MTGDRSRVKGIVCSAAVNGRKSMSKTHESRLDDNIITSLALHAIKVMLDLRTTYRATIRCGVDMWKGDDLLQVDSFGPISLRSADHEGCFEGFLAAIVFPLTPESPLKWNNDNPCVGLWVERSDDNLPRALILRAMIATPTIPHARAAERRWEGNAEPPTIIELEEELRRQALLVANSMR